ncbi:hypothetical protein [Mucilaginibacter aquariorum]|uniref:Uncharacterized protein n=1 Tax=Mucilaginibacter aquariorum TaxID=2967225 RepID=A0ABT1T223_9SPHI|nr:hypothetical protein [Mucilaginibacter aquariorum]MCQ6958602.1 hypothetical protein [Mucilaginibacter aquariorum]
MSNSANATPDDATLRVWEKTIDVQQHFNNIELQIRNYALTLFTAILAGIGYLLKEKITIPFHDYLIPSSAIGAFIGIVIMCAFYFMDKYWYHKLLIGSVTHAMRIENKFTTTFEDIGLSTTIGKYSPVNIMGQKFRSDWKYYFFYYPLIGVFVALYFILLIWA